MGSFLWPSVASGRRGTRPECSCPPGPRHARWREACWPGQGPLPGVGWGVLASCTPTGTLSLSREGQGQESGGPRLRFSPAAWPGQYRRRSAVLLPQAPRLGERVITRVEEGPLGASRRRLRASAATGLALLLGLRPPAPPSSSLGPQGPAGSAPPLCPHPRGLRACPSLACGARAPG